MRVAVVGIGSIGVRHLAALAGLGCETIAVRRRPEGDDAATLAEAADRGAEAAVFATPTAAHADGLREAVALGLHAYVEKPLAASSVGLAELLAEAESRRLVVATGYNLRFHPALEAVAAAVRAGSFGRLLSVRAEVGKYLPDWHPGEDYHASYSARRDLGGGALLTLSHELDYVRWIAGEIVDCRGFAVSVSSMSLDVDDVADLVCTHENGVVSSVHMDLIDRAYNRRSRWVGEDATIEVGWGSGVRLLPADEVLWQDTSFDLDETYRAALADFLACVRDGAKPRADGRDGLRIVELCEAVVA